MKADLPEAYYDPSPAPWAFHEHIYGFGNVLIDRDGRVITTNVKHSNGAMMAAAPALVMLALDLIAGVDPDVLRQHARTIMRNVDRRTPREPGDDDE